MSEETNSAPEKGTGKPDAKRRRNATAPSEGTPQKNKKSRIVRNFPASPFEEALTFAKSVLDFGAGATVRRVTLFNHLGKSPESSLSRQVITNANKYGLIKGGYQADILELTSEGKKLPTSRFSLESELDAAYSFPYLISNLLQDSIISLRPLDSPPRQHLLMPLKSLMLMRKRPRKL
ncbi:hypothetical protein J2W22_000743 [Sphingomonas kyeonggiensis]|uniref:hypothetical protein n=1 Tax=Sphingomonas kyeonggiensis TaxID=1268553 RepID=UPI00277E1818|nr:hypothetical protein [Sphingomonas kyeonggiensis]MDQ0248696.1 hypothetical protein [Sphingomonas kyeonggiensis]